MTQKVPENGPTAGKHRERVDQVVLLIASGGSITHVAATTGISRRTLNRWSKKEAFRRRIAVARAQMFERGLGLLAAAQARAAAKMIALVDSKNEMIAYQASKAILEMGNKLHAEAALGEIKARLDAVEAHQAVGVCQPQLCEPPVLSAFGGAGPLARPRHPVVFWHPAAAADQLPTTIWAEFNIAASRVQVADSRAAVVALVHWLTSSPSSFSTHS